ncbi:hypothetical protein WJX82_007241 [Trebouxia sp. C0006]
MTSERGQTLWLSDDLWARIFSFTKTKPTSADGLIQYLHPTHATRVRRHQEFHKLRLVCKRFQLIFEEHVDLSSCLFLDESNVTERLPSALQWLQRCHNSVEWLAALTQVMATERPQVWCIFGNETDSSIRSDMASDSRCRSKPFRKLKLNCHAGNRRDGFLSLSVFSWATIEATVIRGNQIVQQGIGIWILHSKVRKFFSQGKQEFCVMVALHKKG